MMHVAAAKSVALTGRLMELSPILNEQILLLINAS